MRRGVGAYRMVAPQVPCGGVGASGMGRENLIGAIKTNRNSKPCGSKQPDRAAILSSSDYT